LSRKSEVFVVDELIEGSFGTHLWTPNQMTVGTTDHVVMTIRVDPEKK